MDRSSEYETDFFNWSEQQASALRGLARSEGRRLSNLVDLENLAEEVEDMGRSELIAVRSLIRQLLIHVLKAVSDDDSESLLHWRKEVIGFHNELTDRVTPSMLPRIDLGFLWRQAIKEASAALAIHGRTLMSGLPGECPLQVADILDSQFDLERATAILREVISNDLID